MIETLSKRMGEDFSLEAEELVQTKISQLVHDRFLKATKINEKVQEEDDDEAYWEQPSKKRDKKGLKKEEDKKDRIQ
jgi:hypothetical protein